MDSVKRTRSDRQANKMNSELGTEDISLQHWKVYRVSGRNYTFVYLHCSVFIYYFEMKQMATFLMLACCSLARLTQIKIKLRSLYLSSLVHCTGRKMTVKWKSFDNGFVMFHRFSQM